MRLSTRRRRVSPAAESAARPAGVTALSVFFLFGSAVSFTSFVSLLFPGSLLEPMWRLNPRAHEAFNGRVGGVSDVYSLSLLRGGGCRAMARCPLGLQVVFTLLTVNLIGDLVNTLTGAEPRAIVGVPVVAALLLYLRSDRVRRFYGGRHEV